MKTLCIDYGLRRIGLASTDPSGTIASPLLTIPNKGDHKNIITLTELITQHAIDRIVIGLPLYADGNQSPMSLEVNRFVTALQKHIQIPITTHPENHSSREAEDHIRNTLGIKTPAKIKELLDKFAAYVILKSYLEEPK